MAPSISGIFWHSADTFWCSWYGSKMNSTSKPSSGYLFLDSAHFFTYITSLILHMLRCSSFKGAQFYWFHWGSCSFWLALFGEALRCGGKLLADGRPRALCLCLGHTAPGCTILKLSKLGLVLVPVSKKVFAQSTGGDTVTKSHCPIVHRKRDTALRMQADAHVDCFVDCLALLHEPAMVHAFALRSVRRCESCQAPKQKCSCCQSLRVQVPPEKGFNPPKAPQKTFLGGTWTNRECKGM